MIFKRVNKTDFNKENIYPICFFVIGKEIFFKWCDFDEPAMDCLVYQWSVRSPAERVVMFDWGINQQQSSFFKILPNDLISIFDLNSLKILHSTCEESIIIERYRGIIRLNYLILNTNFIIIFTESRRAMNDSCSCIGSYKITREDLETTLRFSVWKIGIEWLIFLAD